MNTRISPTLVGMFVLGALLLAVIAIMTFGGVNLFSKPQRFIVYFDESIHGLDLGSPVKLRGVRVGRVVDMNVLYDTAGSGSHVAVVCEFNRNVITDAHGGTFDVTDRKRLESMVTHGLRAELGVLGLATGMLYVELDFMPPGENTALPIPNVNAEIKEKYVIVPAMPSAISALQSNITQALGEVKTMNLPELARDLDGLIKDARTQINSINLAQLSAEITHAAKSVSALADSAELRQTFADLGAAVNDLRNTLAKLDKAIDPAGEKLNALFNDAHNSLAKINEAADGAKNFMNSQNGLGEYAASTLRQVGDAAAAVQRLMDYLERNPSALISGKKQPDRN